MKARVTSEWGRAVGRSVLTETGIAGSSASTSTFVRSADAAVQQAQHLGEVTVILRFAHGSTAAAMVVCTWRSPTSKSGRPCQVVTVGDSRVPSEVVSSGRVRP